MKLPLTFAALVFFVFSAQAETQRHLDVIVVLKADLSVRNHESNRAKAGEIARGLGIAEVKHSYGTALHGFAARIPEGRLDAIRKDPRVRYVSIDGLVSAEGAMPLRCPVDGCSGGSPSTQVVPWGVARIGGDATNNRGAGVHVYILDTGIDSRHADLMRNLGNGVAMIPCVSSGAPGSCSHDWDDDNGHGTHIAGTIGAADNRFDVVGIAPRATLHSVKVLDQNKTGAWSAVIAGIDWVADETRTLGTATVANMSLGSPGLRDGVCPESGYEGTDAVYASVCNAKNLGVVFAVSAGNSGGDAESRVPAAFDDAVMAVSATNSLNDWPFWSNYGDNTAAWTSHTSAPVAIAAPGASILSTQLGGGTVAMSGTSMAAPHVAGALALYLWRHPQPADGTAFAHARDALLSAAESTSGFGNTSGRPHAEYFLNVRGL